MKAGQQALDLFLGDDSNYVKLPSTGGVEIATQNFNQYSWIFGTDGALTIPGDIKSDGNINIDINLSDSTLHRWSFGEDGELTLPGGRTRIGTAVGVDAIIANEDEVFAVVTQGTNGSGVLLWIEDSENFGTSNLAAVYTNPEGSGTVRIATGANGPGGGPKFWTFNDAGALTFPQGTTFATADGTDAFLIDGAVDKDVQIYTYSGETARGWLFGTDGALIIPGDIKSEGAINIDINLADSTLRRWTFGEDGDLILPAGGDIKDSTGTSVLGGGGTGTITFTNNVINGADFVDIQILADGQGANIRLTPGSQGYIQADSKLYLNTGSITLTEDKTWDAWDEQSHADIISFTPTGANRTVAIGDPVNGKSYTFKNSSGTYNVNLIGGVLLSQSVIYTLTPGGVVSLTKNPSANSWTIISETGKITNGAYTVSLGSDGKLTAPGNLQVDGGKLILNTGGNAYVESVDYGVNSANSALNIFGGPYQKINLRAGFGTQATWTLSTNGSLTFPNTTVQTTAWTGVVGTQATLNVTGAATAETFNTDQITIVGNRITTTVTNANLEIECNGTGGVVINTVADATTASTTKSVGYLGLPQSATATSATLAIGDAGKHIYVTTNSQTITIPAAASVDYPIGTTLTFIAGPDATTVSIAITSDTLRLAGGTSTGTRTLAANGMATAVKVAATTWYINGVGLT
jgi:hypothetical protein